MILIVFVLALISAWYLGYLAFAAGLPVARWSLFGLVLGPLAIPLFNVHSELALRKIRHRDEMTIKS
ncbi:hypothetical protein [Shewanella sp.]|uniref:hypothetical protein n=1 Tax=Shewanella sp. TaxID=50422 RepID=UPI003F3B7933